MSKTIKWSAGDLFFSNDGKTRYCEDDEKVAQDIAYFILAETQLTDNRRLQYNDVLSLLSGAIMKLKALQAQKTNISDRERIESIVELVLVPDEENPKTSAYFFVTVRTAANDTVPFLYDATNFTNLSHLIPANFE